MSGVRYDNWRDDPKQKPDWWVLRPGPTKGFNDKPREESYISDDTGNKITYTTYLNPELDIRNLSPEDQALNAALDSWATTESLRNFED